MSAFTNINIIIIQAKGSSSAPLFSFVWYFVQSHNNMPFSDCISLDLFCSPNRILSLLAEVGSGISLILLYGSCCFPTFQHFNRLLLFSLSLEGKWGTQFSKWNQCIKQRVRLLLPEDIGLPAAMRPSFMQAAPPVYTSQWDSNFQYRPKGFV